MGSRSKGVGQQEYAAGPRNCKYFPRIITRQDTVMLKSLESTPRTIRDSPISLAFDATPELKVKPSKVTLMDSQGNSLGALNEASNTLSDIIKIISFMPEGVYI